MKLRYWRRFGHIPALIVLQIIFIVLFAKFVIYNPENALHGFKTHKGARDIMQTYPRKWSSCRSEPPLPSS